MITKVKAIAPWPVRDRSPPRRVVTPKQLGAYRIMTDNHHVVTPHEYALKYNLKPTVVAHEHCITENAYRRQLLATTKRTNPSATTCRVSQLLDFIRQLGYEPPNPIFFD